MDEEIMLTFIDEIIRQSGLKLPDDFIVDYRVKMLANLQKQIWLMMVNELDDSKLKEFVEITGGIKDPENFSDEKRAEFLEFFQNNIKDFNVKVLKVMDKFGKEFLSDIAKLKTK
ncbi:hypothetical protein ACFL23_04715 [Patescibacteria group bacterium]